MKHPNSNPHDRKRHVVPATLLVGLLGSALAIAGCEPQAEPEVGEPEVTEPQAELGQTEPEQELEGEQEVEGEVIEREIRPGEEERVRGTEVEEGEEEVTVRRRVVVRQMEELQIPTVRICEEYADLNEANVEQLVALGVPQNAAQSIVQYREEQGPFTSMDQLRQVQGIDQNTLAQIRGVANVRPQNGQQQQQQQEQRQQEQQQQ